MLVQPLPFSLSLPPAVIGSHTGPLPGAGNGGLCARCGVLHLLPSEPALQDCLQLAEQLSRHRRIDWTVSERQADSRCATGTLFGETGGKMFGVLCCRDSRGAKVVLRAFSGQYNGLWQVAGWVAPIFDVAAFTGLVHHPEREIKRIGREIAGLPRDSSRRRQLTVQRRTLSRQLMRTIHGLYQLRNFRGERLGLTAAFIGKGAPPSGTGDCCGPKLLHHAAVHGLIPEAMAEFYWGRSNASATRVHGVFYPACRTKCQPILGFQLCGLP
jgi:hypothetical protein